MRLIGTKFAKQLVVVALGTAAVLGAFVATETAHTATSHTVVADAAPAPVVPPVAPASQDWE
ncbi:hypothetical protein [Kitasatospora sp. McL0602]|uniref:hypothetical protein n=1 Tax=Kitasatospora sp. McL0602 TaxID=3439530 RepID=UPI003F89529D